MSIRMILLTGLLTLSNSSLRAAEQYEHRFLYLDHQPPILFNVNIQLDGQPLDQARRHIYETYFHRLDDNNDGKLTGQERNAIPNARQLQDFGVRVTNRNQNRLIPIPKEPVTKDHFVQYMQNLRGAAFQFTPSITRQRSFRPAGGAGFRPANGRSNNIASADQAIYELLDQNQDNKLTASEFAFTPPLWKKDLDDDERISISEITANHNPATASNRSARPIRSTTSAASPVLIEIQPGTNYLPAVTQILKHYTQNEDETKSKDTLSLLEWGTSIHAFQSLDSNEDRLLDIDELTAWLAALKPAFEIHLRFGRKAKGETTLDVIPLLDSGVSVLVAGTVITIDLGDTWLHLPVPVGMQTSQSYNYARYFQNYDRDKNDYLNEEEVQRVGFVRNAFSAIDRNGDKKIDKEEYISYYETLRQINAGNVSLNITNQGRPFFSMLDQNRDNRLSQRELLVVKRHMNKWDANHDQAVTLQEIPQQWQFRFLRSGTRPVQMRNSAYNQRNLRKPEPRQTNAVTWFQKMDRNKDGDLSEREFLGPLADFKIFDKNNDGLISPDEVADD